MKVCVLVPVHNEEKTIGSIVDSLKEKNFDVLVIDDGSSDASAAVAKKKGARVYCNQEKCGKGYSLRQGFSLICQEGYDGVLMLDGDGQHEVADIENFVAFAETHQNSIIVGNRMQNATGMPLARYVTNKLMSLLISIASRQSIPDTQCGYRYIGCDVLKAIVPLVSTGFEIETEMLMKACKKGVMVYSVPVKTIYNNEESKINFLKDSFRFFTYFFKEIFNR